MSLAYRHELWLSLLLVGVSLLWTGFLPWAVSGMVLLSLTRWLDQGRWSVRTPIDGPALVVTVMALVSLWITPLPEVTLPQVLRLLSGLGLFYAIVNWLARTGSVGWLIIGAAGIAPALSILALFSVEWPAGKLQFIPLTLYDRFSRLFQDTIHPNVLAGNVALVLPIGLALFLFPWGEIAIKPRIQLLLRSLLGILLIYSTAVTFLTQSRAAWIALFVGIVLLILLRFRRGWLLVLLTVSASLVALFYTVDWDWVLRWLRSSYRIGDLSSRIELWARGIFMLEDFFFTGIGMGTFAQTTDALYPLRQAAPPHVHNLYLQVGVDLGVPGLIAWLAIFLLVTLAAWHVYTWQGARYPWTRYLGAGLIGSQVVLALHGLFDSVTWGMIRPAPLVWCLWGLCLGAYIVLSTNQGEGV